MKMYHLFGAPIMLQLASPFQRKNELKQSPNQTNSGESLDFISRSSYMLDILIIIFNDYIALSVQANPSHEDKEQGRFVNSFRPQSP